MPDLAPSPRKGDPFARSQPSTWLAHSEGFGAPSEGDGAFIHFMGAVPCIETCLLTDYHWREPRGMPPDMPASVEQWLPLFEL